MPRRVAGDSRANGDQGNFLMSHANATPGLYPTRNPSATSGAVKLLSHVCFVAGFVSILASILVWVMLQKPDQPHGERLGIFIGLWAPTFFALSDRLDRYITSRSA